jgi:hypothetical protein
MTALKCQKKMILPESADAAGIYWKNVADCIEKL